MMKIIAALGLALLLAGCQGVKSNNGLVAQDNSQETKYEQVESVTIRNQEVPVWALWAMGAGIFCFALIIPSPFKFKGF